MATHLGHACKWLGKCGGCEISTLSDIDVKITNFKQYLKEHTSQEHPITVHLPRKTKTYRTRVLLRLHINKVGIRIGFFEKASRVLVGIKQCENSSDTINRWLCDFGSAAITCETQEKYRILVQEVIVESTSTLIFQITPAQKETTAQSAIVSELKKHKLCSWVSGPSQDVVSPFFIYDKISENKNCYTKTGCFQQANKDEAQQLKSTLHQKINTLNSNRIIDLFSGTGYFSLALANKDREVIGYDLHTASIDAANHSVEQLNTNAAYYKSNLYNENNDIWQSISSDDTLIIDPPRSGLQNLSTSITEVLPKQIYYISCNYESLAEDLKALSKHYDVQSIDIFDFMPNTTHLEFLVDLKIK